ncbi:hypothetical protein ACT009_11580 [Sphingomonas sp. Tas61C01]|uniref:hypothetical protein n=1 Tax=Sphingomonas sp. Tas61C01 TaxID=3458297 RepID=UPI00403E84B6
MRTGVIPWDADATVVRLASPGGGGDPQLTFEGKLGEAVRSLRMLSRSELRSYRISLPNHHSHPRSFEGNDLYVLLTIEPTDY